MKGLILKDFYTMASTIKTYALIIVLYVLAFGIMEGDRASAILISTLVISMAPVTAIAYDEQSKWDKMARTMPVTTREIVVSKYIFSIILSVAAAAFATFMTTIFNPTRQTINVSQQLIICGTAILLSMFYHSLLFPTIYKFGTTKGRIYTMLIVFIPAILTGVVSFFSFWPAAVLIMLTEYENLVVRICILLLILIYMGSISLSVKIYKNKDL